LQQRQQHRHRQNTTTAAVQHCKELSRDPERKGQANEEVAEGEKYNAVGTLLIILFHA
jgi:hypothetical protein